MVCDEEEEEEEEDDGLGTSSLPSVFLTRTQNSGHDSGGFVTEALELELDGPPRLPLSLTDSGDIDREEIEEYLKSLKRKRPQKSNHFEGEGSSISDRSELWMLPVPVHSFYIVFMIE